ncbi:hypothetical protein HPB47_000001 [Ixodes persulcatus]|uniref:Uncharacterized protein n=1 Tax=Ixodes persulcatus TaxID=34615 RepID=A0AC60PUA6_IXOPE|nr:hypothetical protein HPB47_000001 [Ixodes persulcatus]
MELSVRPSELLALVRQVSAKTSEDYRTGRRANPNHCMIHPSGWVLLTLQELHVERAVSLAVYRKVCKLGFQARYESDEEFAVLVRMFPALAFLQPAEVPDAFEDLVALFPPEAMPLPL